jgi:hypothetical protein
MTNQRKYRIHRRAAWLAVFALLLQSFIPVFHHPASMAFAGTLSPDVAKHLCLAPGSAPVAPSDQDKVPHHQIPACAICQAMHAIGGFAPPAAPAVALVRKAAVARPAFQRAQFAQQRAGEFAQPRGPPAST